MREFLALATILLAFAGIVACIIGAAIGNEFATGIGQLLLMLAIVGGAILHVRGCR